AILGGTALMAETKVESPEIEPAENNHAAEAHEIPEQQAPPPQRDPYFRRHPGAKVAIAAIVLLLIVGGVLYWLHARVRENTDDAQIEGDIVPVASRIYGTVISVNVNDNQAVKKGD